MDNIKTGQFIKDLRTEKGLTQQELAEKLNCTNKAISRWETGSGSPDIDFLAPLAEILGVSVNELLAGERIKEDELLQKSDKVIINTMKESKKQKDKLQWIVFIISCLFQALITLWLAFERGSYDWLGVTVVSIFITTILILISSKKMRFATPVTSAVIYSIFSFLNRETILYIVFYFVMTAILSQIVFAIKKFLIQKALKKYKEKDKKTQKTILKILTLILVILIGISTVVVLEYTHAFWVWQDVIFAAPPTKEMLEKQPDRGSEDKPIIIDEHAYLHYFKPLGFPWDSEFVTNEKIMLTGQNREISQEYFLEYSYEHGYFTIEHEVVKTNFDVYQYYLTGSPTGDKWLVTVERSGNGYKVTCEK